MKNLIAILQALLFFAAGAQAQFARLQIIHNAPSASVDVYVNGVLSLDNFAFRAATPFNNIPAGVPLSIAVAPANSSSAAQAFYTTNITFENGETYALTAIGIQGNAITPFGIVADPNAREGAVNSAKVDVNVLHGGADAPAYDVIARAGETMASNLAYGEFSAYRSLDPGVYYFDVKPAGGNTISGTYRADLSVLGGGAARIFMSGLLGGSPAFKLFAAFANGSVVELPLSPVARVQLIHNAPDQSLDIYTNGTLLFDSIAYFTATPFVFVNAGANVNFGVALDNSLSVEDTLANVPVTLVNGGTYVMAANGIPGDPNTPFDLIVNENAREIASDTGKVDVAFFHGSPDAPAFDVDVIFVAGDAAADLEYGSFSAAYTTADTGFNDIALRIAGSSDTLSTWRADLSAAKGRAVTVFAGGFLSNAPEFRLFAVLTDGTLIPLTPTPFARMQLIHNAPDPTVDLYAGKVLLRDNFAFRTATPYLTVPANRTFNIGLAPAGSGSSGDAFANFPVSPDSGNIYAVFVSGISGNINTPLTLLVDESREAAQNPANIEFNVHHGSPNAPPLDLNFAGTGFMVGNLAYSEFSDYTGLPPATYQLEVKPTGSPDMDIFTANLNGLAGKSARVFASGLAGGMPAFGLFAAFTDGTVVPFPRQKGPARVQLIHNAPGQAVDVYMNGDLIINDLQFRTATPFGDIPGGDDIEFAFAPGSSNSAADAFATFTVTLEAEFTYVMTTSGVAGGSPAFDLIVNGDGLEQSVSAAKVDISVLNGAPDASELDADAVFVADNFIENLAYNTFTPYLPLDPDKYDFAVRANGSANALASYRADLSALAGNAAVVFASGYLTGSPAFGLFAAFPNGAVLELTLTPTTQVQLIHNSPDATVDVYAGNTLIVNDFPFRTATAYMEIPADRTFDLGIAPAGSASAADIIAASPVGFESGKSHCAFASGIAGGSPAFAFLSDEARETALNPAKTELAALNGAPDAPPLEISIFGAGPVGLGLAFGDFAPYYAADPETYLIQVRVSGTGALLGTYQADLNALGGEAVRLFTSGLLGSAPAFGLFAALADGTVIEFPQVANPSSARLQLIHNSPAQTVDVYVDGELLKNDFAFRTATPFIDVPANVPLSIAVAPGNSTSAADAFATFPATFDEGGTYVATASGIEGDPTTPFTLIVNLDGREIASAPDLVDVAFLQGSTDVAALDIDAVFVINVIENLAYGDYTPYAGLDPEKYDFRLTENGSPAPIATYRADLSGLAGSAAWLFTSGLLNGTPAFGLFAALPDGTVLEFPLMPTTRVQIVHNAPNQTVDVYAGNTLLLNNFAFRTATPFVDIPADRNFPLGVAMDNSSSAADTFAAFPVNFESGKSYTVMASGLIGVDVDLFVDDNARETATPGFSALSAFHGLFMQFPFAVDVNERLAGNIFDNVDYGDFTPYFEWAGGGQYLDVLAADSGFVLGTHYINPAIFSGKAARIFTSGVYGIIPDYSLYAVFPDGTVIELPHTPVARVQFIHNAPAPDPAVDVYSGAQKILDNVDFHAATPFFYLPAESSLDLGIAPANSLSAADVFATFPLTFENRRTYVVVAAGTVGGSPGFNLYINGNGREHALNGADLDVAFFNGAPDVPEADAALTGPVIFDDVAFGAFDGYKSVMPVNDFLQVTPAGNVSLTYFADFSGLAGQAITLFTSGYLNDGLPGFEVWVAEAGGDTYPLQLYNNINELDEKLSDLMLSPNPAADHLLLRFNLNESEALRYRVRDATGRLMLEEDLGWLNAGAFVREIVIGVLPSGMYQLEIVSDAGVRALKFLVQR